MGHSSSGGRWKEAQGSQSIREDDSTHTQGATEGFWTHTRRVPQREFGHTHPPRVPQREFGHTHTPRVPQREFGLGEPLYHLVPAQPA